MMERNLHKDALIVTKDTDVVHLMQYENNYTKLIIDNLEIEEGYDYFVVFKKDHDCVVYEMPIETNEIPLGAYITNQIGVYYFDIVYRNDSIDQVVIGSPFRIIVEKGIYNQPTSEVNFPEPIQSKYQDLINLINEVRYDLDNDVFKGEKGDTGNGIDHITFQNYTMTFYMTDGTQFTTPSIRGEKGEQGERGESYVLTSDDKREIAEITEEAIQPKLDVLSQAISEKMETYRVEVWDIDTPNARFEHIKNDGTSERVYYADLIDKYNDPKYFLYCEYVTFGVTLIPSLPPLDYDPILEFTANWEYSNVVHQSRVIVNYNNEIKYNDRELAQKNDIPNIPIEDMSNLLQIEEKYRNIFSFITGNKQTFSRVGDMVFLSIAVRSLSTAPTDIDFLLRIPEGYRPTTGNVVGMAYNSTLRSSGFCYVRRDGSLVVKMTSAITINNEIDVTIMWAI